MSCRCGKAAVMEVRRLRAEFCRDCFLGHCTSQVRRMIAKYGMIRPGERVLVAVSGGKDSLGVWDMLLDLGYSADGVYLGLGIGRYSDRSAGFARDYAQSRGVLLREVQLLEEVGFTIPKAAPKRSSPCAACGLSKRHLLNQAASVSGYDVLVTGHNLDDEASVLLGNVMAWDLQYLARQRPVLPAAPGLARKVKPLVALSEREMAAYCVLKKIRYIVDECPMAAGNKHLALKELLNAVEDRTPGSKTSFYHGYLDRLHPLLGHVVDEQHQQLHECRRCGAPTSTPTCAFCRLQSEVLQSEVLQLAAPRRAEPADRPTRPAGMEAGDPLDA